MLDFTKEIYIEQQLRKQPWLIPFVTLIAAVVLYAGLYWCMIGFKHKHYWTIVPAGIIAHAFIILVVHYGSHKAITQTVFDRFIMNLGTAVVFLPFYAEFFRKYHLTHHANTNTEVDPLWPPVKKKIFESNRALYILGSFVPFLFTVFLLMAGEEKRKNVKMPSVKFAYFILSTIFSVLLIVLIQPPLFFVLGTVYFLNIVASLRHWCEHIGHHQEKESNTYWFPLGMGIGNHEAHHHHPHFSWFTMMLGLFYRKKDTNPIKAFYGIAFDKDMVHYKEVGK